MSSVYSSKEFYLASNRYGFANRIRCWAALGVISNFLEIPLKILWEPSWSCPGSLDDVVDPTSLPGIFVKKFNSEPNDHLLFSGSTVPSCGSDLFHLINTLKMKQFSSSRIMFFRLKNNYGRTLRKIEPSPMVKTTLSSLLSGVNLKKCLGVHVRETDHIKNRLRSGILHLPVSRKLEIIRYQISKNYDSVFLACDDINLKNILIDELGTFTNVIYHDQTALGLNYMNEDLQLRNPKNYRQTSLFDTVVDLFALAHCGEIVGTQGSSFSVLAGKLGSKRVALKLS